MASVETKHQALLSHWSTPRTFVQNVGQTRGDISYLSNKPGSQVAISSEEVLFLFTGNKQGQQEGMALSLRFLDANTEVLIEGRREASEKVHYFIGNDPEKWHTGLSAYQDVLYRELWSGVDLVFYGDKGSFKYDVIVKSGANIGDIRFTYRGTEGLSLSEDGNLQIHTSLGVLTEERPVSYQVIDGQKVSVESRFVLYEDDSVYGFEVGEGYLPEYELVIDPTLEYSTYLGGSDTDIGFSIAVDSGDNAYVTGQTLSLDFPITPGAFQPFKDGSSSAFVTKINPQGTGLVYSTFLGGGSIDSGRGIAVNISGEAYVTGQTLSPDFPITPGAFQPFINGAQDAFVTKLSQDGGSLIYSTYLGGEGVDIGFGIAIDDIGNAYVAGGTSSINFPLINSIQGFIANEHAFVTKLNAAGSALEYSTLLGGHGLDEAHSIAIDASGNAYVTGSTTSLDFPTTPGAFQIQLTGVIAAFVSKINNSGTFLEYSTFLTSGGDDDGRGIAVDELGQAYVTGSTTSFDFPVTPGAFQPFYGGGASDAFVTKLSPDGNYLVYSTFLGGNESDAGNGIAVRTGFAYVTGGTGSFNFPITPDAFQPFHADGGDAFLTQFNIAGNELVFSTYLGGISSDSGNSIAVDNSGCIFLTGQTSSTNFPVTPGAFQPFLRGGSDAFVIRFCLSLGTLINKFPDRFEVRRGEEVIYTIEIQNPSAATLTNVNVQDPFLGLFEIIPEIPPFSVHIVQFHFIVPFDQPFGVIRNTVFVTSDQFTDPPLTAESEILVTGSPVLVANKTVNPQAAFPGETVIFTITLENQGDFHLINVHIVDPLLGLDQFIGDIFPGEIIVIEWPFEIPPDAQAGLTIANFVTITADNLPQPEEIGTVVEVLPVPRLEITKTADRFFVVPGETVNYTITVINTGNVELTNIRIFDDLTGSEFFIPVLFPLEDRFFIVAFEIPLEMPPGTYINTATAVSDQTEEVFASAEIVVQETPQLGIIKIPESTSVVPGQTILYTVVLENIGNVPLTGIRIVDPVLGIDEFVPDLQVGEVRQHVFPFIVPRDSPIGSNIVNVLIVETQETGQQEVESVITVTGLGLNLSKEADQAAAVPGETVTYILTVTNLLNTPQTNVILTDLLLGLSETIPVIQANETITRILTLIIPLDAGIGSVIRNTFIVESDQTPPQETIADVVVVTPPGPALLIQKLPDRNTVTPGGIITYTITVTNLFNFAQTNVILVDELLGFSDTIPLLPANDTITLTLTFNVPLDAEIGSIIRNTFIASSDQSPELESTAEVVVEQTPEPSLLIHKLPDRNTASPGETITYTLTVTNLLDSPQTNVVLTDVLLGLSETIPILPANGTITLTFTFTVPLDAVPGSIIRNTFIASSDQSPEAETVAEVTVQEPPGPSLLVQKVADRNTAAPGEVITYTLTVTNLLNADQTNVVITDVLLGFSETIPVLPANGSLSFTVTFTIPLGAVIGSTIRNTLIASSDQSPETETIAEITVQEPPSPVLLIQKVADRNTAAPGDTITYTLTVTNLLAVPQTNVVLSDVLLGLSETIPVLPANGTITFTLTFTVPLDAVIGSVIRNIFTAVSNQSPELETVSEVNVEPAPLPETTLTIRKLADRSAVIQGETIQYTVEVTNTGENPATSVVVHDSLTGQQFTIPVIAPGDTVRVNFEFTVSSDTEQGTVIANRVTVTWPEQPPGSLPVQDEERVTVAVPSQLPELEVEATPELPRPGETVTKTITVTNVTNITLTNVRVFDSLLNFRIILPSLAPGERRVFTLQLPIPSDAEGGTQFRNIVTIFSDQTPQQQEEVLIVVQSIPDASLTETVDRPIGRPEETVFFTIIARNTGNVPLLNVRLTGPLLNLLVIIEQFEVGATETLRIPFVLPDVEEDTVIVSPVTLVSDNGPTREASASVTVIVDEE